MKQILTIFLYTLLMVTFVSGCSTMTTKLHSTRDLTEGNENDLFKNSFPLDFIPRTIEIAAIGDSLTKGVGSSSISGGYLPYLESALMETGSFLDIKMNNFGVRGERTDELLKRLRNQEIINTLKTADVILVTTGGNDIMKVIKGNISQLDISDFENALPDYEKNISQLLQQIRNINEEATVYLLGVYNPLSSLIPQIQEFNTIIDMWNQVSQDQVNHYSNMFFVDIASIFAEGLNVLFEEDFFHPNDLGYEKMASAIYNEMIFSRRINSWGTPMIQAGRNEE
ncbi:lysophospholipase L1-like esterase [Bacillus oleivorans]|uniref:Lysophospholipase L1-like esterase n=1 Tax=Bacillus oleivorans TaxID=1448271 RepID=A0A285CL59_9BACI|nr:GDSL-type esterase/lipase family protein [Bacillus oleivorans]SNX68292.1 lysophospholipase L1-like esterase [Bacillus oleivorans]